MKQIILMLPVGVNVGLSAVSMGLVHALETAAIPTVYLDPFNDANLSLETIETHLSRGEDNVILETILDQVEALSNQEGILVIQGMTETYLTFYASELNQKIAYTLNAKIIFVAAPNGQFPAALKRQIKIAAQPYGGIHNSHLIGCMINKIGAPIDADGNPRFDLADPPEGDTLTTPFETLFTSSTFPVLGCFPWKRELIALRIQDIAKHLNATIVSLGNLTDRRVKCFALLGSTVEHLHPLLQPDVMLLIPGDRSDAIVATCLAYVNGIKIAGIVLTGEQPILPHTMQACHQAIELGLPILSVSTDLLKTSMALQTITPSDNDLEQIHSVQEFIAQRINNTWLQTLMTSHNAHTHSPLLFRHQVIRQAREAKKTIVLPEGEDPRIIQAATLCLQRQIAHPVLIGNRHTILEVAANNGIKLPPAIDVLDPAPYQEAYVPDLLAMRKHKGLTEQQAREALQSPIVIATMMLAKDEVDGLVAGAVHTTADTLRPALMLIKTKPGVKRVSSLFFMCLPSQVLVYGDCAVNQNPNPQELADIAIQCADSAQKFGITPRVAMISYSTGESGTGTDVEKVRAATTHVKQLRPDIIIDGPLQYDAAINPKVAKHKAPNSPVAGQATVFVFPELNTANTTYKAVQHSAHALSIGPMLQGLKKPVNDLSRGASVDDIVYTIAITAIQAS